MNKPLTRAEWLEYLDTTWKECADMKEDDDTQVYRSELEAAVKAAYKDCAQIAETAEPYQAADLIRARAAMLFDDWDGGFPYKR